MASGTARRYGCNHLPARIRLPLALSLGTALAGGVAAAQSRLASTAPTTRPAWDTFSDTWVATDGVGRSLPTCEDVGPPRPGKAAVMFYYLWQDSHAGGPVRDVAKLLAADPAARVTWHANDWYFWGEPVLGYYRASDPAVLRAHAAMLSDAGVDAVVLDSTNGDPHTAEWLDLCRTFAAVRSLGQPTPAFAHLLHRDAGRTTRAIHDAVYGPGLYADQWFRWDGKPLLMTVAGQTPAPLRGVFTERASWAWHDPHDWFGDGRDRWPWLDTCPQQYGWHVAPDRPEEISVSVARHPAAMIGRSFHADAEPAVADPAAGLYFAEQWRRAAQVSPDVVFITNFNEWINRAWPDDHPSGRPRQFMGHDLAPGQAYFVDEYSPEFSRDIEPAAATAANLGLNDNYYYQTVAGVRRCKGVRPIPPVAPRPITIDAHFDDWRDVTPEFHDTLGDPVHRDWPGFADGLRYVNQTGRNDIVAAKVSTDATNLYFYVRTAAPLTPCTDPDWMLLYLDVDHDARTGWLGYDFVVNRSVTAAGHTTVQRNVGGRYQWETVAADVRFATAGNEMEVAIPRSVLRLAPGPATVDFKWADHCYRAGDWTDFTLNGDAAPDFRFNFRAKLPAPVTARP